MSNEKLSDNERMKSESHLLRGTITEDLKDRTTGGFTKDNFQLIRFHGMYQQDDRDIRSERTKEKLEPLHTVMLRIRLPGGIITPEQWLGMDVFASQHTQYGSMRVTNRQTLQLHGVLKHDIQPVHQLLNSLGLDSRATAGDVNRNVLCTSNPVESHLHEEAYEWAKKISEYLLPRTHAYAEVWLGKKKLELQEENEPILGNSYLPRKFKIAVVIPPQNDVDVHANDLSFVAIEEQGHLVGFNVLVGGGLAMTHGDNATYPRLASDFGFINLDDTLEVAAAVVSVQRDWGNRSNRRNARTKYTVDRVGVDTYRSEVELRAKMVFSPTRPYQFTARGDRIGWTAGVDGKHHLTLYIPSGRILDVPGYPVKTAMAHIAKIHQGDFRLTPNQNVIIAGVPEQEKARIDKLAHDYQLINDAMTQQRKSSMACVSFPTCPLAMAEAERVLPEITSHVDQLMAKHQISNRSFVFRVTGCPNGCGRAMLAEVGLVGRAIGRYDFYIGGNAEGTRIPRLLRSNQTTQAILDELDGYLERWSKEAFANEAFGDFSVRVGIVKPVVNSPIDFFEVVE